MIVSSSVFSFASFKIDYFFLPSKAEILPLTLEIWHQLMSSEIQTLGKCVVIHLLETTCITFSIMSAYLCTLSLQFPSRNFFPTGYLLFRQNTRAWWASWDGSHSCFILLQPQLICHWQLKYGAFDWTACYNGRGKDVEVLWMWLQQVQV